MEKEIIGYNKVLDCPITKMTDEKQWECLICGEEVNDNEMCKCMRDAKNGT